MKITITRAWLDACGYRNIPEDREYPVIYVYPRRLADGTRMFDVDFNNRIWTVAEWRCSKVTSESFDVLKG